MIQFVRKYASVMVLALMSAFAVCLIADEWLDMQRAWADLQIEAMAELEMEDFEWDEDGADNGDGRLTTHNEAVSLPTAQAVSLLLKTVQTTAFQSNEQKRGLVRRYAPRKGIVRTNYRLI